MKVELFVYSAKVWALTILLHMVFFFISFGYNAAGNISDTISMIILFLFMGLLYSIPTYIIFFLVVQALNAVVGSIWVKKALLIATLSVLILATLHIMGGYKSIVDAIESVLIQTGLIAATGAVLLVKFPIEKTSTTN